MAKRWTKKKVKLVRKQARNTSRRITSTGREIREDAARTVRLVRRNVIAGIRRVSGRDEPNHLANPIDGLEDLAISGDAVPMLVENQQDPDVVMTDAPPRGSEGSDNTTIVHVTSSLAQKGQDRGLQPSFTYDTKYSDYYQQAKEQYEQHQQQQQQLQEQQEQLQQQQLELLQQQQEVQQLQLQQQQQQQLSSPLNQSQSQSQDQSQDQSRGYPFSEAVTGTPSHTYNFPPYHDQTIEGVILQLELLRILHETYGHPADQSDGSSPQNAGENDGNGNNRQDSGGSYLPEFDFTPELEISEPDDGWGDSAPGQSRLLLEFNQKGSAHADLYGADDTAIAVPGSDEDVPTIGVGTYRYLLLLYTYKQLQSRLRVLMGIVEGHMYRALRGRYTC
ncbi:hypothetical protein F5Y02DRAFT_116298 [Annulohypoxylon stygium]|nr:hypothetical protein F5Y02DRAFT_116298 [Annulohypoxylon stygium]